MDLPKDLVRATLEIIVEPPDKKALMKYAKEMTREMFFRKDWKENYPLTWQEALAFILTERGIAGLPESIRLYASSGDAVEINLDRDRLFLL